MTWAQFGIAFPWLLIVIGSVGLILHRKKPFAGE